MAMELSRLALLHFYLPEVNIQVKNGHGTQQACSISYVNTYMEVACQVLNGHF